MPEVMTGIEKTTPFAAVSYAQAGQLIREVVAEEVHKALSRLNEKPKLDICKY